MRYVSWEEDPNLRACRRLTLCSRTWGWLQPSILDRHYQDEVASALSHPVAKLKAVCFLLSLRAGMTDSTQACFVKEQGGLVQGTPFPFWLLSLVRTIELLFWPHDLCFLVSPLRHR